MTGPSSTSSSVEVAVDPDTAFTVFTEEVGCWWLQGPINFFDSTRAYGVAIEPGVGGRLMEVYDPETGDGLELGVITVWERGARLAWRSSLDDVEIDVRFEPTSAGTLVRVEATISVGGQDRGGTAWVRVTPDWFAAWADNRDRGTRMPKPLARLGVGVHYADPASAARWLRDVFGFVPASPIPEAGEAADWIELRVGTSAVILFAREGPTDEQTPVRHTPWVFVDDVDAHRERVGEAGARIVEEIWQRGARAYCAADPEGNHWTFAQCLPLMR
jgi:uncharacterized glyoxalase superfamily protein PhnB